MPEPMDHAENRGWIETILQWVPGFRGYLKKENRREADELQRQWLADRLQRSKRGLDEFARALTDAVRLDELPKVERLRTRLDKLLARIQGAMQGYSGFFDLVEVDEAVLDRVYQFDVSLMEQVNQLAEGVEGLPAQLQSEDDPIAPLMDLAAGIDDAWDGREDILKGLE